MATLESLEDRKPKTEGSVEYGLNMNLGSKRILP